MVSRLRDHLGKTFQIGECSYITDYGTLFGHFKEIVVHRARTRFIANRKFYADENLESIPSNRLPVMRSLPLKEHQTHHFLFLLMFI